MKKVKIIAIGAGHNVMDGGAFNKKYKLNENMIGHACIPVFEHYVNELSKLEETEFEYVVKTIERENSKNGYIGVPARVNAINPDVYLELHANANSNKAAAGHYVLHYFASETGKLIADTINNRVYGEVLGTQKRANSAVTKGMNGYNTLFKTSCPAVILEPFFMSNDEDTTNYLIQMHEVMRKLALTVVSMFETDDI